MINVASTAGLSYAPGMGIYSISKAGVIMLTKTLAAEWAEFGIQVNCVAPGLFKTRFSELLWSTEEFLEKAIEGQAIKRLASAEDVVGSVVFLASPLSDFVTGHTLVVDGGGLV